MIRRDLERHNPTRDLDGSAHLVATALVHQIHRALLDVREREIIPLLDLLPRVHDVELGLDTPVVPRLTRIGKVSFGMVGDISDLSGTFTVLIVRPIPVPMAIFQVPVSEL